MIKIKKLKVTLLMGVITCFVAVFCCMQVAFANNAPVDSSKSDIPVTNSGEVRGYVACDDVSRACPLFTSFEELENICMNKDKGFFGNEKSLQIVLLRDFDINNNTLKINNGRTFKIVFNGNFLWSYCSKTMIEVENGNLILEGNKENRGKVQQTREETPFKIFKGGTLQANHVDFLKNAGPSYAPSKGGVFYFDDLSNNQVFNDCTFKNTWAYNGGAIYVGGKSEQQQTIKFNDCQFDGCGADQGGAIANKADNINVEFNNTTITNCHCYDAKEGGAIAACGDNDNYYFDNSVIEKCFCGNDGGAIYVKGNHNSFLGTASLKKDVNGIPILNNTSKISDCESCECGGAIYTSSAPGCGNYTKIENITFVGNECKVNGGAICSMGKHDSVNNCQFLSNNARNAGGAICAEEFLSPEYALQIHNSEFFSNSTFDRKGDSCCLGECHKDIVANNIIFYQEPIDPDREVLTHGDFKFSDCFEAVHFG